MLRKIMEVCKKHWIIISDIVFLIVSVVIANNVQMDVRPFLILPVAMMWFDVHIILLDKPRCWRRIWSLFCGVLMYVSIQGAVMALR